MQIGSQRHRLVMAWSVIASATGLTALMLDLPVVVPVIALSVAIVGGVLAWRGTPGTTAQAQLIAEVAHELRTPLTGVLGTLELLTESTIPLETGEVDELLQTAHSDAYHLLHVVSNLHSRSRLDRSILEPVAVATDVRSIVERAVSRSAQVAGRSYLSPGSRTVVHADPQLVMQIVTNVIQNIERYAPEGEVHIDFAERNGTTTVSFRDHGPGISPADGKRVFTDSASTQGLGLGLGLSRQLARAMGGDLTLEHPAGGGATFSVHLPSSAESPSDSESSAPLPGGPARAHSPRARLLVDLAEALSAPSLDSVVGRIHRIYQELLGATGTMMLVSRKDGSFYSAGSYHAGLELAPGSTPELDAVRTGSGPIEITSIDTLPWASETSLGGTAAMLLPVHDAGQVVAVLVVGWKAAATLPVGPAVSVAVSLANLTASAIARTALTKDVVFERRLRSSVLNELPIAVSVFVGDPPEVIDWNRKEKELLGIEDEGSRSSNLAESQHQFDVRFADGTPLTVDNAPVTRAIRTGKATGPFILLVKRADGSQVHTRTYCAPFFNSDGDVAGAVVTSEPLDLAVQRGA